MKCLFINNGGAGFADYVEVAPGTTVNQFFAKQVPNQQAEDYLIRVDRQPVSADQVLVENDRISHPLRDKIAGAQIARV